MPIERAAVTNPPSSGTVPQLPGRLLSGTPVDLVPGKGDHLAESLLGDQFDGFRAEDGAKRPIHIGGAAASLQMPEHDARVSLPVRF